MEMTKREFAEKVAEMIGGKVIEVKKANGIVLTGINKAFEGENIMPNIYIDEFYRDGADVEFTAKRVEELINKNRRGNVNMDILKNFEMAKEKLIARLYNKKTNAEVYKSAEEYGFDDLIIIPYIDMTDVIETGYARVSESMFNNWNVTVDEVIDIALENSAREAEIATMQDVLRSIMIAQGAPEEVVDMMIGANNNQMYVVSTRNKIYGAISVITQREKLKEMFPDGYIVIPSSIHEVLVVPMDDEITEDNLTQMVNEVNDEQVALEEQLGDRAYVIEVA